MNKHKVKHHQNWQQKQEKENHIRTTALEQSVMNYWGGGLKIVYGSNLTLSY